MRALRRRLGVILLCLIALPGGVYLYSSSKAKLYSTSAQLLFRQTVYSQTLFGQPLFQGSPDANRQANTNIGLVDLPAISQDTAQRLRLPAAAVSGHVSVSPQGQSDLVNVTATDHSPQRAALIANAFAQAFIDLRRSADKRDIVRAQRIVREKLRTLSPGPRNAAQRGALQIQADQLATLASLQSGPAQIAQAAQVPGTPSSPKPIRDAALALVVAIMLALAIALMLDRLDRRLHTAEQASEAFPGPIIGAIPHSKTLEHEGFLREALPPTDADAFLMLRANLLYYEGAADVRSLLVTSAQAGDGKTTVAVHLAATAGRADTRVLLIEADLRRGEIAEGLGMPPGDGLSEVLSGQATFNSVLRRVAVAPAQNGSTALPTIDLITAGGRPPNPSALLGSERMRELLEHAHRLYDLIVIDTPPLAVVADAFPLVGQVSGVIAVCRLDETHRAALLQLGHQLEHLQASMLGLVINDVHPRDTYYSYGYAEAPPHAEPAAVAAPVSIHERHAG